MDHTKWMDAHEFRWTTLMSAAERSRARDVFRGFIDQELEDNAQAILILSGQQLLLTDQKVERLRTENNRACVDLSKLLSSELKKI